VSRHRGDRGFPVIELLIASVIMFVGLIGLMDLSIVATRSAGDARRITEACALAQDRLETLRSAPLRSLAGAVEGGLDAAGATGGPYTRTTQVAFAPTGQASIQVRVSWTGFDGRAHALAIATTRAP
jgi:Tfp pilus assembly protein PilV